MGSLNWADLQKAAGDAGFDPVPVGPYDVIISASEATTASSGKDMIKVRMKIETGPYAGRILFHQFVISPDSSTALAFFFRHMSALGLKDTYFATGPTMKKLASDLEGHRARVTVGLREWQGQEQNEVKSIAPPADGVAVGSVSASTVPTIPGRSTPTVTTSPSVGLSPSITPSVRADGLPTISVAPTVSDTSPSITAPELPF